MWQVTDDWDNRIQDGVQAAYRVIDSCVSAAVSSLGSSDAPRRSVDDGSTTVLISFSNPLGWSRYEMATVPSTTANVVITDPEGQSVPYDALPHVESSQLVSPSFIEHSAQYRAGAPVLNYELIFPVSVPALGFAVYTITAASASGAPHRQSFTEVEDRKAESDVVIDNDVLQVTFSAATGRLSQLVDKRVPKSEPLATLTLDGDYLNYTGPGVLLFEGAYVFNPHGPPLPVLPASTSVALSVTQGKFITRVTQLWSSTVKSVSTVYQCHPACQPGAQPPVSASALCTQCDMVHVTSTLGSLYDVTQDIVLRYSMNASSASESEQRDQDPMSASTLYTVENGFQSVARAHRGGAEALVSGNFFPMPAAAYLRSAQTPKSRYAYGTLSLRAIGIMCGINYTGAPCLQRSTGLSVQHRDG